MGPARSASLPLPDIGLPLRVLQVARKRRKWRRAVEHPPPRGHGGIPWVYRTLARHGSRRALRAVLRIRTRSQPPRVWLDAVVATVLLRWAEGSGDRARAVLRFAGAYYDPEDLERGLARAARRLRVIERARRPLPSSGRATLAAPDWAAFERAATAGLGPEAPPRPVPVPAPRNPSRRREPVVLSLTGGLGNQLFQYAAARSYAERVGASLLVDLAAYAGPRAPREMLLSRLRLDLRAANLLDVARAMRRPHRPAGPGLDAAVLEGRPGLRGLSGYWEHPAYFAGFEAEVEEWFRPKDPAVEARARALVESHRRPGGDLVAVHVRLGDRVQGRAGAAPHRSLPVDYYRRAAALFPSHARFLVFSDSPPDIAWCRAHLGLDPDRVEFAEGRDPVLDLVAMSRCDHLVAAGSTFSWWAGWLGRRAGRTVVVPDPRVCHGPVQMESARPTRIPPEWLVLPLLPQDRGNIRCRVSAPIAG